MRGRVPSIKQWRRYDCSVGCGREAHHRDGLCKGCRQHVYYHSLKQVNDPSHYDNYMRRAHRANLRIAYFKSKFSKKRGRSAR